MTEHPGEEFTGGAPDEPRVEDLLDETRRPDEDHHPAPDPQDLPETPEPPD